MTAQTPDPVDLERRVDRALKGLPTPLAPATLLSRVMRVVEGERADALVVPAIGEWPVALKLTLSVLGAALIVAGVALWPSAVALTEPEWESPTVVLIRAAVVATRPWIPVVAVYLAAMCAAAAAAVSLLKHVALGGASQS